MNFFKLGITKPIFVGASDGGMVAQIYTQRYHEEVGGLILVSTGGMIPFCIFIFLVLVPIIAFWNGVTDFKTAYIQAYILLVVMNWFDGIVFDRLWVGHSKIWKIEGMEGIPYIKPWKSVLVKRSLAMVSYLAVALVIAGLVVLVSKF